jgi:hypothetical protein
MGERWRRLSTTSAQHQNKEKKGKRKYESPAKR